MSIVLYLRAREAKLGPVAKAVLTALCFVADEAGGNIYPSIPTLARWTSFSERAIRDALDELDALYISRPRREERIGGRATATVHYKINIVALPALPAPAPRAPLQDAQQPLHHVQPTPAPRAITPAPRAANRQERLEKDQERPGNGLGKFTWEELQMMARDAGSRKEQGRLAAISAEIERRQFIG